jgi:metal-sulfur cluster biosynthetic enzyme
MGDLITENADRAVRAALPEGVAVEVVLVSEPPWTPDMMSESARQTFGWPR